MIEFIDIKNFRRHKDTKTNFNSSLTAFVGENDTGKSSLLDAIKAIFKNYAINQGDFLNSQDEISIAIKIDGKLHRLRAAIKDGRVEEKRETYLSSREMSEAKRKLPNSTDEEIKALARELGIKVAANSSITTLKQKILELLDDSERYNKGFFRLDSSAEIGVSLYVLSGRDFDNLDKFIHEAFFRNRQRKIWDSPVELGGETISVSSIINEKLGQYKTEAEEEIKSSGITEVIKTYIDNLKEIQINPSFDKKEIGVSVDINLITADGERVSTSNLGDGSKRRLTVALLEHKAINDGEKAIYLFDEPDTHLHVRAQNDLLNAFDAIARRGNQIIITTHSPFIMNSVRLDQIRMLNKYRNISSIKNSIREESGRSNELLALGIENLHLFFSKKFVLIEGETEEAFFPLAYEKIVGRPPSRDFIKIITAKGIENIPRFAEIFRQFACPDDIYILSDNDATPRTQLLIDSLDLKNTYTIGTKEFEDSFLPDIIYEAWKTFIEKRGSKLGDKWTSENLTELYFDSDKIGQGVSKFFGQLNEGTSYGFSKQALGIALADYCLEHQIPQSLQILIRELGRFANEPNKEETPIVVVQP